MIAEPYICTKGHVAGDISWLPHNSVKYTDILGYEWQRYADFEREKLKEICGKKGYSDKHLNIWLHLYEGYRFTVGRTHLSSKLIGYSTTDYDRDSESTRLLKRAEFLKAVCDIERVEWLSPEYTKETKKCDRCGCDYHGPECPVTLCKALEAKCRMQKEIEKNEKAALARRGTHQCPPCCSRPRPCACNIDRCHCFDPAKCQHCFVDPDESAVLQNVQHCLNCGIWRKTP